MPDLCKQAIPEPMLKKLSLDPDEFKNFRPIPNLRFTISNIIEKCVAKQLTKYLNRNGFGEPLSICLQEAYSSLLYYYMRNFCSLIGLEQWYFSLI